MVACLTDSHLAKELSMLHVSVTQASADGTCTPAGTGTFSMSGRTLALGHQLLRGAAQAAADNAVWHLKAEGELK
jgi:hypothetical protein